MIPLHPLTNFEIQKYYENELRFNDVYPRDKLPKQIKDGANAINLDKHKDTDTHWLALCCKKKKLFTLIALVLNIIYLKKLKIYRVQANNSIMCGYFCIGFIDFMLAGKTLTDYTNLFSPYDFNKNDNIILSYFKDA